MTASGPRRQSAQGQPGSSPPAAATTTLLRYLQQRGVDSRRRLVEAIVAGRVSVNHAPVTDTSRPVDPIRDQVRFDGHLLAGPRQPLYLMMNKPSGVITTTRDEKGRRTVIDLLPARLRAEHLFPIGRLDADTEGLLLITNDGDLAQRLSHPSFESQKEYLVTVAHELTTHDLVQLRNGIHLEDGVTAPARVEPKGSSQPGTWTYAIAIHEGRNRQVRRMFGSLGYKVLRLVRVRVKDLHLAGLRPGDIRALTAREIRSLRG